MRQMHMEFESGLMQQFPEFKDVVRAGVYSCGRAFKAVAADLDMSVSELSRKLANNPNDPVHFPLDRLPELLAATGDLRPVYWLAERFIEDPDARRDRVLSEAQGMLKRMNALLDEVVTDQKPGMEVVR